MVSSLMRSNSTIVSYLSSSHFTSMGEVQDVFYSSFPLLLHFAFLSRLRLSGSFQTFGKAVNKAKPFKSTLDYRASSTAKLFWSLVFISFTSLIRSMRLFYPGDIWVADEDPGRLCCNECGPRWETIKEVFNLLSQLPSVWDSSVRVMKMCHVDGEVLLWNCPSWMFVLLAYPFFNIETVDASLKLSNGIFVPYIMSARFRSEKHEIFRHTIEIRIIRIHTEKFCPGYP